MSCNELTTTTPLAMTITSEVTSSGGPCTVSADGTDRHQVTGVNRTNNRYQIEVSGECKSPCIRYSDFSQNKQQRWDASFDLPPRPGKGGSSRAGADYSLTSLGPASYQSIRVDVTWTAVSFPSPKTERLSAQVTTL
jgi:hypothetical protein